MLPIFYRLPLMHQDLDNITGNRRFHLIDYVECFNSCYELPHLDTITHSYQSASPGFGRCMKDPYKMRRNMMLCFYRCGSGCGCNNWALTEASMYCPFAAAFPCCPLLSGAFALRSTSRVPSSARFNSSSETSLRSSRRTRCCNCLILIRLAVSLPSPVSDFTSLYERFPSIKHDLPGKALFVTHVLRTYPPLY